MRNAWTRVPHGTSRQRWNQLCETIKALDPKKEQRRFALLETALKEVVLQYTYPRLDADVSKHRNHLLKSPFVVHPGTSQSSPLLLPPRWTDTLLTCGRLMSCRPSLCARRP